MFVAGNFPPGPAKITIHHGENHNILASYENKFVFKSKLDEVHNLLQTVSDPMTFLASVYGLDSFDEDAVAAVDLQMTKNFNSCKPSQLSILKSDEEDKDAIKGGISYKKNNIIYHIGVLLLRL